MTFKASVNGPNRAAVNRGALRGGSAAADDDTGDDPESDTNEGGQGQVGRTPATVRLRVRSLERHHAEDGRRGIHDGPRSRSSLGDACLVRPGAPGGGGGASVGALLRRHREMISSSSSPDPTEDSPQNLEDEPILIHFHDIPIYVLRVIVAGSGAGGGQVEGTTRAAEGRESDPPRQCQRRLDEEDVIYLSEVQRYNHKICEDTVVSVTCCSRPSPTTDYDPARLVGVEVYLKHEEVEAGKGGDDSDADSSDRGVVEAADGDGDDDGDGDGGDEDEERRTPLPSFSATDVARTLLSHAFGSVLTVNELLLVNVKGRELVCRVYGIRIGHDGVDVDDPLGGSASTSTPSSDTAAEAAMEDPYRGRVGVHTQFVVAAAEHSALRGIADQRRLPEERLPDDVVHVTTSDGEWFPVKRSLLAPCIKLTRYVQAGRGRYADVPVPTLPREERSEDAPEEDDGCPHCKVPIDCCTFDRVLLFILSMLYPKEKEFHVDLSEVNSLADAAEALGLQSLADLCAAKTSSIETRVRRDAYIRFAEVQRRNGCGELLIVLDGMVLDITRWIDEHPGGPSIIPAQALNIDCTVFFEMYHVSRQSFLYLKSFYIGELSPEDRSGLKSSAEGVSASEAFLESLRSYTAKWRVVVEEDTGNKVHKSF